MFPMRKTRALRRSAALRANLVALAAVLAVGPLALAHTPSAFAQDDWSVTAQPERQQEIAKRYMALLERNPTEGMAFRSLLGHVGKGAGLERLIAEYAKKVEAQPDRVALRLILGHLLKARDRYEEAFAQYEKAVELAPEDALAWVSRGSVRILLQQRPLAREDFERALTLEKNPDRKVELLRQLAELSFAQRDWEQAEKYFDALVATSPRDAYLRQDYVQVLMQHKRYDKALEQYRALLGLVGSNPRVRAETMRDMAEVLEAMGKDEEALKTLADVQRMVPASSYLHRDAGQRIIGLFRRQGRLEEWVREHVARWPRPTFEQATLLGELYDELGREKDALAMFQRAIAAQSRAIEPRQRAIRLLERMGEERAVLQALQDLMRIAPGRHDFQFDHARQLMRMGQREEALKRYADIGRRFARDTNVQVTLADIYQRYDMPAEAQAIYEKLVRLEPSNDGFIVSLGEIYFQSGERQKALDTWDKILKSGLPRAEAHSRLGEVLVDRGFVDMGVGHYQQSLKLEPDNLLTRRGLATALERARRWEEALELWKGLMQVARKSNTPHQVAEARGRIVDIYRRQNTLRKMMMAFDRAFQGTPPDLEAGYFLAESHLKARDLDAAQAVYARLVELAQPQSMEHTEALMALERIYTQSGKYGEAIAVVRDLAEANPKLKRDYYQRMAELSLKLQAEDEAVRYASLAVEANPDDAAAHARLASVYRNMGQMELAAESYKRAMDIDPRAFDYAIALADLLVQLGRMDQAEGFYRRVARQAPDEALILRAARRAFELAGVRGKVAEVEAELVPLVYQAPPKPVYRKVLVELYRDQAEPWWTRQLYGTRGERAEAKEALRQIAQRASAVLMDALQDTDIAVRAQAIRLLGMMEQRQAGLMLARMVEDPRESLRVLAAMSVAQSADERAGLPLVRVLDSGDGTMGDVAAWALGYAGGPEATERLAVALERGDNANLEVLAAMGLGRIGGPRAIAALEEALVRAQTRQYADSGSVAVLWALGRAQSQGSALMLGQALHEAPERSATVAAWSLGRIGTEAALEQLLRARWGADPRVRERTRAGLLAISQSPDLRVGRAEEARRDEAFIQERRGTMEVEAMLTAAERHARQLQPARGLLATSEWRPGVVRIAREGLASSAPQAPLVLEDLAEEWQLLQEAGAGGWLAGFEPGGDQTGAAQRSERWQALVRELAPQLVALAERDARPESALTLRLLAAVGDERVVRLAEARFKDAHGAWRSEALAALLAMVPSNPQHAGLLARTALAASSDAHERVRQQAARALGEGWSRGQTPPSAEMEAAVKLCSDRFASVRHAAAKALGYSQSPRAVAILGSLLEDEAFAVQAGALGALERLAKAGVGEANELLKGREGHAAQHMGRTSPSQK